MTYNQFIDSLRKRQQNTELIRIHLLSVFLLIYCLALNIEPVNASGDKDSEFELSPLLRTLDLNIGESVVVELHDGTSAEIQLIDAAYYPTRDIQPGDKVYFKVRSTAEKDDGYDVWDFDDGSDKVSVKSNTDSHSHAKVGYAIVTHRFEKPCDYLVRVERETSKGTAAAHVYVQVHPFSQ